ncbi:T9SS type A sorting domain-containing protein [Hymenobacter sp. DH14]|uniref:T9SS type A sorting domain-containing protein n=1 Tax=Hymenobacter cyanobacteriorum TaxID=2926463 RepID=A0A9X1VEA8_9BACT|nr:T9SS type A sorting domain-containing protein [Hymenobacter cyanobacteriorum]MCI1186945.1 T9SS type A sorting domain-containing protein [Hymenobacter cyanobacteriorum]
MLTPFRSLPRLLPLLCAPLLLLLLQAAPATAQVLSSGPLTADPGRAQYAPSATLQAQYRTAALSLPFFDDFTTPLEGNPSSKNWLPSGGAFVSNRLALLPPTRGAATLDGLRANGQVYGASSFNGPIDSLTSQPINLGNLGTSDQVYLSFAWQAGNIAAVPGSNRPGNPVRLELFVKTNTGTWESKWFYNAVSRRTGFSQVVIDLNQTKYLHGDFQFRFVASGNPGSNSDTFSVDYVLLDRSRSRGLTDTTFTDVATGAGLVGSSPSGGLRSPLRRFTAMPVWQYNAASPPSSELNPRLGVNVSNLSGTASPLSVDVTGTVRDLTAGTTIGSWLQTSTLVPGNARQSPITGSAASQPLPVSATPKRLRYTLALNSRETIPRTLANDTIFRDVELNNYYAYDDGTAENTTFLLPYPNGPQLAIAYRFDVNQPDFVRGLRLVPVFTPDDTGSRQVTISVWGDKNGLPDDANILRSKTYVIPAAYPAGWKYFQIDFDQPVPVSGTFHVGFSQPSTGRTLPYGLDLNSTVPPRHLFARSNTGQWDSIRYQAQYGAPLMRPVMTNNVATATTPAAEAAAFALYPNPAHGAVRVAGPAFARAAVLDAVGRVVWQQPAAEAGQSLLALPSLPPGVYLVRLALADGRTVAQRLLLE